MPGQEQVHGSGGTGSEASADTFGQIQSKKVDLTDILDEIDSVLETNAEEFVKGFVQKGGQ